MGKIVLYILRIHEQALINGIYLTVAFNHSACYCVSNMQPEREKIMNGQHRKEIRPGAHVEIILKEDQRTGKRTAGIVKDILTSATHHSRGIKVRLDNGQIGRVQDVLPDE